MSDAYLGERNNYYSCFSTLISATAPDNYNLVLTFDLQETKFVHGVLVVGSKMQDIVYGFTNYSSGYRNLLNKPSSIPQTEALFSDFNIFIGDNEDWSLN